MSTRSKKTTTTTVRKETVSTPTQQTSAFASPGRNRPPSPTVISRMQEKKELANLNDRLAAYIDRVRQLESENTYLSKQIQTHDETVRRETTNIKALYEKELADARALLDETAKQRAKHQLEAAKYKEDLDDLKDKYDRQNRELSLLQKRVLTAESQVNDYQARLSDAVGQRKHWEDEYNKLKKEYDALVKQLAACKKQLEDEMVKRVDLENKLQSLKEELSFKSQVHEQELNETVSRTRVEIEEVDGRLQQVYDSRLAEALKEMRAQNEEMIRITREETEEMFARKLEDLRRLAEKNDSLAARSQDEIATFRRRIADLTSELGKLRTQTAAQEARIKELEEQLKQEESEHKIDVDRRDAEIRRLRQSLEEQLAEYRDLLDVKIQLDIEIMAYRKLLEGEETRLNLSQTSEGETSVSSRRTPSRATPVSRKRKRLLVESGESSTMSGLGQITEKSLRGGYTSTSTAKGSVEVYEVDPEGKYIKLYNGDNKDQSIGGWILKLLSGDEEVVYKFYRNNQIKAGQYVTVWSADQGVTHAPPSDLVMKGQKWIKNDNMKAVLVNNQGEEMASRELHRSELRASYTHSTTYSVGEREFGEVGHEHILHQQERSESEGRDSDSGRRSWFWWNK